MSLSKSVEEAFARSQHEIKRLSEELARANEEKQQIQAMLQDLLTAGEDTGASGIGAAMRDLEDRINRLVEAASSISGAASSDASEMTKDSPATVDTDEDDRTAAGPEIDTEAAINPSEEVSEEAPIAAEEVESQPARTFILTSKLDSESRKASTASPVMTEETAEEDESPGAADGEEKEPLELTQMVTEDGAVVDVNADQGHPTEKDRGTAQKIIKRVSLLTGTLREEQK